MRNLRNTTALALGLAALSPSLGLAQTAAATAEAESTAAPAEGASIADCIDAAMATGTAEGEATATCEAEVGGVIPDAAQPAQGNVAASSDGSVEAGADGSAEADATVEAPATAPVAEAEFQDAPEGDAAEPEVAETPSTEAPDADALEEALTEQQAQGGEQPSTLPAEVDPNAAPEAAAEATPDAGAEAEADMTAEGDAGAETDAEMGTTAETTAETAPAEDAQSDADRAAAAIANQSGTEGEAEAQTEADAGAETEAPADADATAGTEAAPEAEGTEAAGTEAAGTEAPAEGEMQATDTDTPTPGLSPAAEMTPEQEAAEEQLQATMETDEQIAEGETVSNAALAAEADAETSDGAAEAEANAEPQEGVTEEVVTEENARSSAEDFANAVNQQAAAQQAAAAAQARADDDDDGLSDAAKIALAGLGALAVGSILNNGSQVAVNSGDRLVVQQSNGDYRVIKDDGALLRQPGTTLRTQRYDDGSTRTVSIRPDGAQIVTVYDSQMRILKRTRIEPNGERYVLIDDSVGVEPVEISALPRADLNAAVSASNEAALREALQRQAMTDRSFTLSQVRNLAPVRALAPAISVETVTFETGSAAIRPEQAEALAELGGAIRDRIAENPREIFLVEGHTDAVGNAAYNLALSDRRAESLALALTEYFDVPAENLVVQGYGEEHLKVPTQQAEEANRRAAVRRVTDLLRTAQVQ